MELGGVLLAVGLLITVISFTYALADATPSWLNGYHDLVERPEGNWNVVLFILGPILLIWGGFTVGEQIIYRRRFERLIDTTRKQEFTSNRRELEDVTKRLPDTFRARLKAKESEFSTRRA